MPAYLSAEPDPADSPPAVPRPRDPGEFTEPLRLDDSPEPLPPSDVDLIAACRAGDSAAHLDRCRAPGWPPDRCLWCWWCEDPLTRRVLRSPPAE